MSIELNKAEVPEKNAIYIDPAMMEDTDLSNKAFVVHSILLGLAGQDFTRDELAKKSGCSVRSIYRAIKELKELGYYYEDKITGIAYMGSSEETGYSLFLNANKGRG